MAIAGASDKVEWYKWRFGRGYDPGRFWEYALSYSWGVQRYANRILRRAANDEPDVATQITAFRDTLHSIISHAGTLEKDFEDVLLTNPGVTLEQVSDGISVWYQRIVDELQEEFSQTDEVPTHEERREIMVTILGKAKPSLVEYAVRHGMTKTQAEMLEAHFEKLEPFVETLIVTTGKDQ